MIKLWILASILFITTIVYCQPNDVDINVNWQQNAEAQGYKIIVWDGTDTLLTQLAEDKSFFDLNLQEVTVYDVPANQSSLSFESEINGEYVQVAGIVVGEFGILSLMTVTDIQRKPDVPDKMQLLQFNITL